MFWNHGGFGGGQSGQGGPPWQNGGFGRMRQGFAPPQAQAPAPGGGLAGLGGQVQQAGMPPSAMGPMPPMQMPGANGTAISGMPQPQQQQPGSWNGVGKFPFAGISKAATGFSG